MKIITINDFLKLDKLERVRALKSIAEGELRIKEKSDKHEKSKCNRNKSKRNIRVLSRNKR
ncbi:MAG: hypothetical protein J5507_00350 [Clostridia bacterium]|nr:hypothetical protein [Clostridia bacterium]